MAGIKSENWKTEDKSPAAELQELLKELAQEHLVDEFIEEDFDEEYIMMLKAFNLTARTLGMLDELESKVCRLQNDLIETKARLNVLEIEKGVKGGG